MTVKKRADVSFRHVIIADSIFYCYKPERDEGSDVSWSRWNLRMTYITDVDRAS
jgi:hypothetical protein